MMGRRSSYFAQDLCRFATGHGWIGHTNQEIRYPAKIAGIRKSKGEVYCSEQFCWCHQEQHSVTLPIPALSLFIISMTVVQLVHRVSGGLMYEIGGTAQRSNFHIRAGIRRPKRISREEQGRGPSSVSADVKNASSDTQLKLNTPIRAARRMREQIFGKPFVTSCCNGRVVHLGRSGPSGNIQDEALRFTRSRAYQLHKNRDTPV
jgi:hypothetical protein